MSEFAIAFAFLFLWTNTPMGIVYVWRRIRRIDGKPTFLGFEGPVICTLLLLIADARPPFQWWLLLLPWVFHFGTWIALRTGVLRLSALVLGKNPRS